MQLLHISALVLINLLIGALLVSALPTRQTRAQHTGAGEGAYDVWWLIDHVEAERQRLDEPTGRHHLRPPGG
ncbi:hypothetical protein [Saccharopolyspora rosea]|uniref:Uncharacterized protein n=1 Tax=Saccharopolyspora rosea TaxID=524884 RepID=A0ABW3FKK7_9PSEU|nr:hypothetical protein [Saccharopolyspora rosea]